jgi:hypothetical protein
VCHPWKPEVQGSRQGPRYRFVRYNIEMMVELVGLMNEKRSWPRAKSLRGYLLLRNHKK